MMELIGDVGHLESRSVCLEMVLVLVQDRCKVYTQRTIGSDNVYDAPDVTPSWVAQVQTRFSLFGDSVSVSAR